MRKQLLTAMGLAVAGLLASQASANVTVSWVNAGIPQATDAGGNLLVMNGYTAYIVRLTSSSGNITAYDFGAANSGGIKGTFASVKQSNAGPLPDNNSNPAVESFDGDTHFLGIAAQLTVGTAPAVDFTTPGTNTYAVAPFTGKTWTLGSATTMTGAIGVQGAFQKSTVDVAYLVVKNGTSVNVAGTVGLAGFSGAEVQVQGESTKETISSVLGVPEPASLGVLTVGGLALLVRRRKA
jgi:hypothetical protein